MKYILLFPLLITLFVLDRVFLVFVFWVPSEKFGVWIYKDEQIIESIHRVLVFLSSISVVNLFMAIW